MNWLKHIAALFSLVFFVFGFWIMLVIYNFCSIVFLYLESQTDEKVTIQNRFGTGLVAFIAISTITAIAMFLLEFLGFGYVAFSFSSIPELFYLIFMIALLILPLGNSFVAFRNSLYKGSKIKKNAESHERLEDNDKDDIFSLGESLSEDDLDYIQKNK